MSNCGDKIVCVSRLSQRGKGFGTDEILHSQLTSLVNLFEIFEHVVRVRVDHGNTKILVVFVLVTYESAPVRTPVGMSHTEYEFSASCDDAVARMFGE